jgi:hypothetical protein
MKPALSEFTSAGFMITRPVTRPSCFSADLLPERIVSLSRCISNFVPDTWCIEWTQDSRENRLEEARRFDLDAAGLARLTARVTPHFGTSLGWPNTVFDHQLAVQLVEILLAGVPDVTLLELGLHSSLTKRFCREAEPPAQQPGFAPNGRHGLYEAILKRRSLSEGGHVLGFEPLVIEDSLSHSWLCNRLETPVAEHLGIRPNSSGMIDTFEDACRCVEYISREDVGAEPGLWIPWLIIEHPTGR